MQYRAVPGSKLCVLNAHGRATRWTICWHRTSVWCWRRWRSTDVCRSL